MNVPEGRVSVSPPFPDRAGTRLQVEGLIAGSEPVTAGIDVHGRGYVRRTGGAQPDSGRPARD